MCKKIFKDNIGSITLFLLSAILFFLVTTLSSYYFSNNMRLSQINQLDKIEKEYDVDFSEMEKEYELTVEQNF